MAQWLSLLQITLWMESTFVMLKTGPIHLALVGLMAGQQSGRLSDENVVV